MKKLREARPKSTVIKHRDASMIGLVDCSWTEANRTTWMEFKLHEYKGWVESSLRAGTFVEHFLEYWEDQANAQYKMVIRLNGAYVVWIKKTSVWVIWPDGKARQFAKTSDVVEWMSRCFEVEKYAFPTVLTNQVL